MLGIHGPHHTSNPIQTRPSTHPHIKPARRAASILAATAMALTLSPALATAATQATAQTPARALPAAVPMSRAGITTPPVNHQLLGNFTSPTATAVDDDGTLYVGNTGAISQVTVWRPDTIGRTPTFVQDTGLTMNTNAQIYGVAVDDDHTVYVATYGAIQVWQLDTTGATPTYTKVSTGIGGLRPYGVAVTADGSTVYVAEEDHKEVTVWRRNESSSTLKYTQATDLTIGGDSAGVFSSGNPVGVAVDGDGTLYTVDKTANQVAAWTLNGSSYVKNNSLTVSGLNGPVDVTVGPNHVLAIAEADRERVTVWQRSARSGTYEETTNLAINSLNDPEAVTMGSDHTIYVGELAANRVSAWRPEVSDGTTKYANVTGLTITGLSSAQGLAIGADHTLYVADYNAKQVSVWQRDPHSGDYTENTSLTISGLNFPKALAVDAENDLYIASDDGVTVWKRDPTYGNYDQATDLTITSAGSPNGVAVDADHTVYVTGDSKVSVFKLADGVYQRDDALTISGLSYPLGVAVDADHTVYVAAFGSNQVSVYKLAGDVYQRDDALTISGLDSPWGLSVDASHTVYVANAPDDLAQKQVSVFKLTNDGETYQYTQDTNLTVSDFGVTKDYEYPYMAVPDLGMLYTVADTGLWAARVAGLDVTGHVTSARGGGPVTTGKVTVVIPPAEEGGTPTVVAGPADIGPDGTFTVEGVMPGTGYEVQADANGYGLGYSTAFDVGANDVTLPDDIELTPQYTIGQGDAIGNGTVTVSPNPVDWKGDATVTITADPGYSVAKVTDTDAEGNVTDITGEVTAGGGTYQLDDVDQTHQIDVTFVEGYTVNGTVEGPNGEPVEGAEVVLVKPSGSGGDPDVVAGPVTTGPGGTWAIPGVGSDTGYEIQVTNPGYDTATAGPFNVEDDNVTITDPIVITPTGPSYEVTGQVGSARDDGGTVTSGTVTVVKDNGDGTFTVIAGPAAIGPDGTFTIEGVVPGDDYEVHVDADGYAPGASTAFDVVDDNVTLPGTINLTPQYDIGGTGVYDHGTVTVSPNPVDWKGDATVTITANPGYSIGTVTDTDAEDNVTDITDQVNASGGTYQLDDIDQTHHIDVTFIEGYTVGGTVQDPNRTPVAGAEVVLVKPDPEGGEPTVVAGPVTTGPGGTWAIPGVLPDTGYEIQVTKPGYDTATSNPFDVQDTNVTITDPIVMTPTGPSYEVTGQVGSTRPGSDPITEGTATLVVPSGEGDGQFTVIAGPVDIQPDGTFTFGHIPEGTDYQVQIDVPGYSTGSSGSFDVADQNVTLPGTIDLTPQYDIGGTGVYDHGTVTVSPNPVDWKGDATVTITADPGYSIGEVTDTDAAGNVTDITDQVNASGGTYQLDDIDQTHHIDVTFIPGHTVTGTVDGPDGQPVAGAEVSVVKPGGSGEEPTVVAGPAITGPDGAYGVPGVDNGSGFQIQVVKPGYYATTSDPFDVEDGDVAIGNLDLDGKYRVRTVTGTTGSATAQTATVPEAGQDTVVITPGPGYQVDRVEDATGGQITDVTAQLVDNRDGTWTLTLKHVMADHVVYVSFKPGGASATNPGGTTPGGSTGTGTTPGGPGTTTPPPAGPVAAKVKAALGQVNLLKGKSYKLVALAYTADGASVPVTFKSSKAKVASVSASGKVKAKKPGKAIITIVSGAQMTKVKVTVLKKRPSSAASTVKKVTVKLKKKLKTGQIVYLTPKLGPKTSLAVKVTFKSTKKKVAAIDKAGRLQAMAKGKATIKVKAGKVTKKLKLTVK